MLHMRVRSQLRRPSKHPGSNRVNCCIRAGKASRFSGIAVPRIAKILLIPEALMSSTILIFWACAPLSSQMAYQGVRGLVSIMARVSGCGTVTRPLSASASVFCPAPFNQVFLCRVGSPVHHLGIHFLGFPPPLFHGHCCRPRPACGCPTLRNLPGNGHPQYHVFRYFLVEILLPRGCYASHDVTPSRGPPGYSSVVPSACNNVKLIPLAGEENPWEGLLPNSRVVASTRPKSSPTAPWLRPGADTRFWAKTGNYRQLWLYPGRAREKTAHPKDLLYVPWPRVLGG